MVPWPRMLVSEAMRLPGVPTHDEVLACLAGLAINHGSASLVNDENRFEGDGVSNEDATCLRLDPKMFVPSAYFNVRAKLLKYAEQHLLSSHVADFFLATAAPPLVQLTRSQQTNATVRDQAVLSTAIPTPQFMHLGTSDDAVTATPRNCVVIVHTATASSDGREYPNDFLRDLLVVGLVEAGCSVLASFDGSYMVEGAWSTNELEEKLFGRGFFLAGSLAPDAVSSGKVTFGVQSSELLSHLALHLKGLGTQSDGGNAEPGKEEGQLVVYAATTSCNGVFPSPLLNNHFKLCALVDGNDIDAPHLILPPDGFDSAVFRREDLPLRIVDF